MINMKTKMNKKEIELFLDSILENNEIDDAIDWLIELGTMTLTGDELIDLYAKDMEAYNHLLLEQIKEENYEICAKIRDVIKILTDDMIRLIKTRSDIEKDEKEDMVKEINLIKIGYNLSIEEIIAKDL